MTGIVHLVGAGPGDPGLITVRGAELLARCDAVVFDALANPALLAHVPADAERHDVGKRGGSTESAKQDDINALLVSLGKAGKRVVRLKGGDPLVFGRGSEEMQALAQGGVRFELVPGVTAGVAAPAYAGIPVTHRGIATSVTFVTGHEDPAKATTTTDWHALAKGGGTIVLYMGVKTLPNIARALVEGGLSPDTPAAAVQWGTHSTQRTVVATLTTLAERAAAENISAPVITIIGNVVSLRAEIEWFEKRALHGLRVAVTRATAQAGTFSSELRELGAHVIEMPAIVIEPLDTAPLDAALATVRDYQWLVLTSQNAVDATWNALRAASRDARALAGVKIASIGPATGQALMERGLAVDLSPKRFVAEGVLEALGQLGESMKGSRVLYVAAEGARDVLPEGLRAMGAEVDVVRAYRSAPSLSATNELQGQLDAGVDIVTFTSASAVTAFVAAAGPQATRIPAACIGPITSEAARAAGFTVACEALQATAPALVSAIIAWRWAQEAAQDASEPA
ncbi:MAG: uroporphyrinogen-III C-methyltransferase / uroporphyrinogen-III synthase [Gemmatimonadetes bacterium]|nr:uroporphyrinogen-III C-methyltransferase / uroporphyrinogen-III synthase [Gemmatimonadota bacterium]